METLLRPWLQRGEGHRSAGLAESPRWANMVAARGGGSCFGGVLGSGRREHGRRCWGSNWVHPGGGAPAGAVARHEKSQTGVDSESFTLLLEWKIFCPYLQLFFPEQ